MDIAGEDTVGIWEFPNLTTAMQRAGWPEPKIRKVMGENWLRLLAESGGSRTMAAPEVPIAVDPATGCGEVRVGQSCFVHHIGRDAGRKVCYTCAGWFPGALE